VRTSVACTHEIVRNEIDHRIFDFQAAHEERAKSMLIHFLRRVGAVSDRSVLFDSRRFRAQPEQSLRCRQAHHGRRSSRVHADGDGLSVQRHVDQNVSVVVEHKRRRCIHRGPIGNLARTMVLVELVDLAVLEVQIDVEIAEDVGSQQAIRLSAQNQWIVVRRNDETGIPKPGTSQRDRGNDDEAAGDVSLDIDLPRLYKQRWQSVPLNRL
jgi:hypothetical protein